MLRNTDTFPIDLARHGEVRCGKVSVPPGVATSKRPPRILKSMSQKRNENTMLKRVARTLFRNRPRHGLPPRSEKCPGCAATRGFVASRVVAMPVRRPNQLSRGGQTFAVPDSMGLLGSSRCYATRTLFGSRPDEMVGVFTEKCPCHPGPFPLGNHRPASLPAARPPRRRQAAPRAILTGRLPRQAGKCQLTRRTTPTTTPSTRAFLT